MDGVGSGDINERLAVILAAMNRRLGQLEVSVSEISAQLQSDRLQKEWYSTTEAAELLNKSDFTVREKWCNQGRIECEKDPDSGKWRIPAREIERLRNGGSLKPSKEPRHVS